MLKVILILFPLLLLFRPRLAMIVLIAAIVILVAQRTRPSTRPTYRAPESEYKPGYED